MRGACPPWLPSCRTIADLISFHFFPFFFDSKKSCTKKKGRRKSRGGMPWSLTLHAETIEWGPTLGEHYVGGLHTKPGIVRRGDAWHVSSRGSRSYFLVVESVHGSICASSMGTSVSSWLCTGNEQMQVIVNDGGAENHQVALDLREGAEGESEMNETTRSCLACFIIIRHHWEGQGYDPGRIQAPHLFRPWLRPFTTFYVITTAILLQFLIWP